MLLIPLGLVDKLSVPGVMLIMIILFILAMKIAHFTYEKSISYDNVVFCPSDSTQALNAHNTGQGKSSNTTAVPWVKCPPNGNWDSFGRLKCDQGYKLSARECVPDIKYNQKVDAYSEAIYVKYLYHKGNVEWNLEVETPIGTFLGLEIDATNHEIDEFLKTENIGNKNAFVNEITKGVNSRLNQNSQYRMNMSCMLRKIIHENLVLI